MSPDPGVNSLVHNVALADIPFHNCAATTNPCLYQVVYLLFCNRIMVPECIKCQSEDQISGDLDVDRDPGN